MANAVDHQTRQKLGGSLKSHAQNLFRRVGIYYRLKRSPLYDLYWNVVDRKLIDNRRTELEFYRKTLRGLKANNLIFDIGANIGQKTDVFLRLGATVIAVEPDPTNQEILRRSYLDLRVAKKPVVIVGQAVGSHSGSQTMWVDSPGSAMNTLSSKWVEILRHDQDRFGEALNFRQTRQVTMVTLEELIRSYGCPFYIKIDVEGYEPSVLSGLKTIVPFISFEVNLPQFKPEALECVDHLERVAKGGKYNYAAHCLRGLALEHWLTKQQFVELLNSCPEPSIEVFWSAPPSL